MVRIIFLPCLRGLTLRLLEDIRGTFHFVLLFVFTGCFLERSIVFYWRIFKRLLKHNLASDFNSIDLLVILAFIIPLIPALDLFARLNLTVLFDIETVVVVSTPSFLLSCQDWLLLSN